MKRTLISTVILIVAVVQIMFAGCADQASANDVAVSVNGTQHQISTSPLVNELLEYDFSNGMSGLDTYYLGGSQIPDGAGQTLLMMMELKKQKACPDREFTDKENWALAVRKLPNSDYDSLSMFYASLMSYHVAYGGLPNNGVELFPELMEATSLDDFYSMTDIERYVKYRHGINPITGKFYSSFTEEAWTPGGVSVSIITDPDEIKQKYPHAVVPIDPTKEDLTKDDVTSVAEVWEITVYGEEEDTVLCNSVLFT